MNSYFRRNRGLIVTAAALTVALVFIWWWFPWTWPIGIDDGKSVGSEG